MAMKQLTTALQEFNNKYYTHRLPADAIKDFGDLLKQYIKDINAAYAAGESEEHTKKLLILFLKLGFIRMQTFKLIPQATLTVPSNLETNCLR